MELEIKLLHDAVEDSLLPGEFWRSGCDLMQLNIRLLPHAFGDQAAT